MIQPPASVHGAVLTSPPNAKDPTAFKDILQDNDCRDAWASPWFASIKDELTSIGTSEFSIEIASLLIDHSEGGVQPRTQ